jgi:hypothetical protein
MGALMLCSNQFMVNNNLTMGNLILNLNVLPVDKDPFPISHTLVVIIVISEYSFLALS